MILILNDGRRVAPALFGSIAELAETPTPGAPIKGYLMDEVDLFGAPSLITFDFRDVVGTEGSISVSLINLKK
jgi:hypothetical protein